MEISVKPAVAKQYVSRQEQFQQLFPQEPAYRWQQIEESMLNKSYAGWEALTNLPKLMRESLMDNLPWLSFRPGEVLRSQKRDTFKVLLNTEYGSFESVLMQNKRGSWTICVSSQIGCGMGCSFCATGKMGFKFNLDSDHIVDQYRFWRFFIEQNRELGSRISNIVFMGMGEPLANYNQVKLTINRLLKNTDLGPTRITVSTVGVVPALRKLLEDPDWPHVRMAISVHSADLQTRKEIVQTSYDQFLEDLAAWGRDYLAKFGNRRHHLTFEYVMLNEVNDSEMHALKLAKLAKDIGEVKVNLIPYNWTDSVYVNSEEARFEAFMEILHSQNVNVTRRKTMGEDIAAACGQLATLKS